MGFIQLVFLDVDWQLQIDTLPHLDLQVLYYSITREPIVSCAVNIGSNLKYLIKMLDHMETYLFFFNVQDVGYVMHTIQN